MAGCCAIASGLAKTKWQQKLVSNNQLSIILECLSEAVFLVDAGRVVLLANKAAREQFGDGTVGRDFVRVVRHPECLQAIDDVLSGMASAQTTLSLRSPLPSVYQIAVVGLPVESGADARAAITFTDITHLHDARQMRSDFVANVSHELRSPLTALNGIIETLKGPARDDAEARGHFLEVMEREALRMNRLVNELLTLSQVEANRRVQPTEIADVFKVVEQVVATLDMQAKVDGKTIELTGVTKGCEVRGDAHELTQVFHNLIENAIKYSGKEAQVLIKLGVVDHVVGVAGRAVQVEVRDQGPGIDAMHIPRLTERFYRVDTGRSREHGGTGLGLAIVKHTVNRHRGRLQIRSELGLGSSFVVSLPLVVKGA
ncbi:MAG: PAS domain-containing protein [Alphaproteobacteria bacterium]|nr:PAS domain-containing protein [Alphaproteobacteria bacterium]